MTYPRQPRGIPGNVCNGACVTCCTQTHYKLTARQSFVQERMLEEQAYLALARCPDCNGAGAWVCGHCDGAGRLGRCLPCRDEGCKACVCTMCRGIGGADPCGCVALGVQA